MANGALFALCTASRHGIERVPVVTFKLAFANIVGVADKPIAICAFPPTGTTTILSGFANSTREALGADMPGRVVVCQTRPVALGT